MSISIVLTPEQVAQVVQQAAGTDTGSQGGTPPVSQPPTIPPGFIPGPDLGPNWLGAGQAVKIKNGQTAMFRVLTPANFIKGQLVFTEKGDSLDNTPRRIWLSVTPGDVSTPNLQSNGRRWSFVDGTYTTALVLNGGSGGQVNVQVGSVNQVVVKNGAFMVSMKPGSVLYLMVQNKDAFGNDSATIPAPNFTAFPNP